MATPYTINMLTKADTESVYVLNTSISVSKHKRSSNVAFEIHFANQIRSVIVHDSWIPQDLSMQAPKDVILSSPSFRDAINKGLIELVRDPEAEKVLADDDAVLELHRIKNKHNKANAEIDMEPVMPRDIVVQKEGENDKISPMIRDLCVREGDELDPVDVFSKIKSAEKALSKDEFAYLDKNLNRAGRNERVEALIKKNLGK